MRDPGYAPEHRLEPAVGGLSGLPRLAAESEWVVAALRARYNPDAMTTLRHPSAKLDWNLVRATAQRHGVVQLIEPVVRTLPQSSVPRRVREGLAQETREIAVLNLELTGELLRVLDLLGAAGIRALPYKGPILAQVAYGGLGLRRFGDLDILVTRADVGKAISVLGADGYRSESRFSPRQVDATLRNGHDWHLHKPGKCVVEVQWAVANREHMLPRGVEPLMDRASRVQLAGREVSTLNPTDQVVVLAVHGGIHLFTRLAWVCDMVEAISNVPGVDVDAALRIAEGAHARRMLLFAVAMVDRILGVRPALKLAALACSDQQLTRVLDDVLPALLATGGADHRSPHLRVATRSALADRRTDAALGLLRAVVTPTASDYAAVRMPEAMHRAYPLVRVARLIRFYASGRRGGADIDVFDRL